MHNALTKKDIELMQKELDERRIVLRPKLLEAVKVARAFGDLSENFEYKAAKQEKNKNESRIRFLENMIRTARVIDEGGKNGGVALYDRVTVYLPEDGETEVLQVVTTMRKDPLKGIISGPCWVKNWGISSTSRWTSITATTWSSGPSKRVRTTAPSPSTAIKKAEDTVCILCLFVTASRSLRPR